MIRSSTLIAGICMAAGSSAWAQSCPTVLPINGGFEVEDAFISGEPDAWEGIAAGGAGWTTDYAHSGSYSIGLGVASTGSFTGWTTNKFDNVGIMDPCHDPDFYGFYDPPYTYQGGDLVVSGYYMIPGDDPLAPGGVGAPLDTVVGVKLETRRLNTSIYMGFEFPLMDVSTTNDAWVPFELTLFEDQILPDWPPFPIAVSILPFRFDAEGDWMGTIYFDDFSMSQGAPDCLADLTGDGIVDAGDLGVFISMFLSNDLSVDFTGDGIVDSGDLGVFITHYLDGC